MLPLSVLRRWPGREEDAGVEMADVSSVAGLGVPRSVPRSRRVCGSSGAESSAWETMDWLRVRVSLAVRGASPRAPRLRPTELARRPLRLLPRVGVPVS
jgi:hypothetical protein